MNKKPTKKVKPYLTYGDWLVLNTPVTTKLIKDSLSLLHDQAMRTVSTMMVTAAERKDDGHVVVSWFVKFVPKGREVKP